MSTHTGTMHWFSGLKGIGQVRPEAGGYDVVTHIGDFAEMQGQGALKHHLVSHELVKSASGARIPQIYLERRL